MGLYYRIILKFILTVIGITLASALPTLFNGIKLDIPSYISGLRLIVSGIIHPNAITYKHLQETHFLFPSIWPRWEYSMILLFISFIIAFLFALALTLITMTLSEKKRKNVKIILYAGESVPDVLVVGLSIVIAVFIHRHTSIPFFGIASFGDNQVFAIPIIVLAILPTLLFYRTMIYDFEEESSQLYTEFAKSKGVSAYHILISHVLRNAIINIFLHSKSIIWFMLSNLLMIEYAFNIDGLMRFMFTTQDSLQILTMGLLLMFIPIYIMQASGQIVVERMTGKQVEV